MQAEDGRRIHIAPAEVPMADVVVPVPRWIDEHVANAYLAGRNA